MDHSLFSLHFFFESAASYINAAGGLILVFAVVAAFTNTIHLFMCQSFGKYDSKPLLGHGTLSLNQIRLNLGTTIIFSLELLVAADVIDTLTKPAADYNIECLYKLALVVAIRSTLAYFLGLEVDELENKLENKHK